MRPTVRRLLFVAAGIAGTLLLAVLALPYLVSLDSMRERAIAAAENTLHHKVEIGKIRLQILSGLGAGLEKVAVLDGPGWETRALVSVDRVSVKVAFWPLFSRRIEVRRIVLDGATVAIERDPSGRLNIDEYLSAGKRDSAPASAAAAAALLVARVEIDRGRFLFVDRKVSPGKTVTLAVEDLAGFISDIGPKTPAAFDLAARFLAGKGRNLTLKGSLGPPPQEGPVGQTPIRAAFAAKEMALAGLAPYFGSAPSADPGTLSIDGKAEGAILGALGLSGNVALEPAADASPIPATSGTVALALDWGGGTLAITKSLFEVGKLPLAIEGRVDDLHGAFKVDLRITTPGDVAIDDVTGLPGIAGTLPEGVRLSGRVRLDARIEGPSADLDTRASLDGSPFGVSMDGQPIVAAAAVHATLESHGTGPLAGRVTAPSGKLKNVPFENLAADWTWEKRALTLSPTATVFGGTLAARLESDFAHPQSESHLSLDVRKVQAKPLVETATSARDVFSGTLNGKIAIASRGLSWAAISKTGHGEGRISVTDADLKTVALMPQVFETLSAVGQVAGFQVPTSLQSTKFSTLETSLKLADGRVATPDLTMSGRDVSVAADGSLGLDKTLSYEGRITLAPGVVKSFGNAGRYMADENGRLSLPFRATGPISGPKVTIDENVALDLGRRVLVREAKEKLGGTAGKILGDTLDRGDGKRSEPLDILQQLLQPAPPKPTPTPAPD